MRLNARIHTPAHITRHMILAHGGDIGQPVLLEGLKQALFSANCQIVEVDLVREQEAEDRLVSYDIPLLARRLADVQRWTERHDLGCPSTVLGTGNAVAAALWQSTQRSGRVDAVISVQGRPHLAEPALGVVRVPTLLMVLGADARALHMNRMAAGRLGSTCELREIIPDVVCQTQEMVAWIEKNSAALRPRNALVRTGTSAILPALSLLRSLISIGVFFALAIQSGL